MLLFFLLILGANLLFKFETQRQDGSCLTFSWPFSYISFLSSTFPGAPYRIFLYIFSGILAIFIQANNNNEKYRQTLKCHERNTSLNGFL